MEKEETYDLVVAGGGLAGVCGALSARRLGLSVAIIQDRPVFGGNASSEIRVQIGGAANTNPWARESGIICELFLEERKRNFQPHISSYLNSNLDLVLYDALRNENVDMFLNTSVRKAVVKNELIESAYCVQLGSEKDLIIKGTYFLDASGDGVLAYSSGAEFRIGREGKDEFGESLAPKKPDMGIMGSSLMFLVRDTGRPVNFEPPGWAVKYPKESLTLKLRNHSCPPGYWWIEIGVPFDTICDNEEIKHNLLAHLLGVWDHLKNEGEHGFGNFVLEWMGMVPGKRESRRIRGDYILTGNDIRERKQFSDAVAYGGWFMDLHTPGGILAKDKRPEPGHENSEERDKGKVYLYSIPFRCLYSKNIKNLLVAGRNISVTHVALGTTRLMGTCALLGQAAGTSVYFCKKYNLYPRQIYPAYIKELQQQLLKDGCFIPGIENNDEKDLLLTAKIKSSSQSPLKIPKPENEVRLDVPRGQKLPLTGKTGKIVLPLKARNATDLNFHLRKSFDLWDFKEKEDLISKKIKIVKGESIVEIELDKDFEKGIYWFFFEKNDKVFLKLTKGSIPGLCSVYKPGNKWLFSPGYQLYFQLVPDLYPFGPENINSGVSRPEKWTNVWISDPREKFPVWVELEMEDESEINMLQITFSARLDQEYHKIPPFFVVPEIPSHYKIYCEKDNEWRGIVEVKNNTECFRRHKFSSVKTKKIRMEIFSSHGGNYVCIYEMRVGTRTTGRC